MENGVLNMTTEQMSVLKEAMLRLTRGDGRGFCDALWLGFGDGWHPVLERLAAEQYIVDDGRDGDVRITSRGRVLAQELSERDAGGIASSR